MMRLKVAVALVVVGLAVGAGFVLSAQTQAQTDESVSSMMRFMNPDGSLVEGFPEVSGSESVLVRDDNEVRATIDTMELPPGTYTWWWVIFNNPQYCSPPECNEDDLPMMNPDADPQVMVSVVGYIGGVVGYDGIGHFAATIQEGQFPFTGPLLYGPGLLDAQGAEIHIALRYHGPPSYDAEMLGAQISTFGGGCNNAPPQLGKPGDFACYEPQAAIHLPPENGNGG